MPQVRLIANTLFRAAKAQLVKSITLVFTTCILCDQGFWWSYDLAAILDCCPRCGFKRLEADRAFYTYGIPICVQAAMREAKQNGN